MYTLQMYIQCRFKITGQDKQNLNFQTQFSQTGLRLETKKREPELVRFLPEIILQHSQPKFCSKNLSFWCLQLIKNYPETTLLIDEKYISQEVSYKVRISKNLSKLFKICF